jgi:hypothetical protein
LDTLSRVRHLSGWLGEMNLGRSPLRAGMARGGAVLLAGGGLTGLTAGGPPALTLLPVYATALVVALRPLVWLPETLPVRGWQIAAATSTALLPRLVPAALAQAALVQLSLPALAWLAVTLRDLLPGLVRVANDILQQPLHDEALQLHPFAWAARGIAAQLVMGVWRPARPAEGWLPAATLVLITWAAGSPLVEAALLVVLGGLGVVNAELADRSGPALRTTPRQHVPRPHLTGARAVLRDVWETCAAPLVHGPGWYLTMWLVWVLSFLPKHIHEHPHEPARALVLAIAPAVGLLFATPMTAKVILGVPTCSGGILPGIPETLPLSSRRYVAATLAQGLPAVLLATLVGAWGDGARGAALFGGLALTFSWTSVLHLWWDSPIWWQEPGAGVAILRHKQISGLLLLLALALALAGWTLYGFGLWAAWNLTRLWGAGRRLLREVP